MKNRTCSQYHPQIGQLKDTAGFEMRALTNKSKIRKNKQGDKWHIQYTYSVVNINFLDQLDKKKNLRL